MISVIIDVPLDDLCQSPLIFSARELFYSTRLSECISFVRNAKVDSSFEQLPSNVRHLLEFYEGLSYFEIGKSTEGMKVLTPLIKHCVAQVESTELDIIIMTLFIWEIFYEDELFTFNFLDSLSAVLKSASLTCSRCVYNFGLGVLTFINDYGFTCPSPQCQSLNILQKAYDDSASQSQTYSFSSCFSQDILSVLAWVAYKQEKFPQALLFCERLLDINAKYPGITNNTGVVCIALNQLERAKQFFSEASVLCPSSPMIPLNLSEVYSRQGDQINAQTCIAKANELNPDLTELTIINLFKVLSFNSEDDRIAMVMNRSLSHPRPISFLFKIFLSFPSLHNDYQIALYCLQEVMTRISPCPIILTIIHAENTEDYLEALRLVEEKLSDTSLNLTEMQSIRLKSVAFNCMQRQGLFQQALKLYVKLINEVHEDYWKSLGFINYIAFNLNDEEYSEDDGTKLLNKLLIIDTLTSRAIDFFPGIIEYVQDTIAKLFLRQKLEERRELLQLIAYRKHIVDVIIFKPSEQHLDILFDKCSQDAHADSRTNLLQSADNSL